MPVLSEQIADVEPSVSTDRSRLTIAPLAASACVPSDSRVVTTAGRPVGIAAIARLIPIRNSSSKSSPRIEAEDDDQRQCGRRHDRDQHGQLVELLGERRLLLLDAAQHPRDVADLGRHPGRRDDHLAAPARHGRVHVRHVDAVAERDVVAGTGVDRLRHRRALAGEPGLLDLERRRHEQAAVGRDLVAGLEPDDVAGHELLRRDLGQLAARGGRAP